MPNPRWNNQHGANRKDPAPAKPTQGSPPAAPSGTKVADWPGLPGKTQSRPRSAGTPKRGYKGEFHVKQKGL